LPYVYIDRLVKCRKSLKAEDLTGECREATAGAELGKAVLQRRPRYGRIGYVASNSIICRDILMLKLQEGTFRNHGKSQYHS